MEPYNPQVKQGAAYVAKQAVSYINAVGMVIGIIAANLADVIFGGIMLGMLFKDIDILLGAPMDGWVLGFISSFAFWFIQMLMWQMIFEDNVISKGDIIPLILAIFVAVADTNIDVSPVVMWIESSSIAATLKTVTLFGDVTLYTFTLTSVIAGLYVVNGCSELFNAWYLGRVSDTNPIKRIMPFKKRGGTPKGRVARQQAAAQQQYVPVSNK